MILAISRATGYSNKHYGEFPESVSEGLGILKSIDGGDRWKLANAGLPEDKNINAIAFDTKNKGKVIVGTVSGGVYISMNEGATWFPSNIGLSGMDVRAVDISTTQSDILFVSVINKGIYKSTDGGQSWNKSSRGLNPESFIVDISINPNNENEIWIADFLSGVYVSIDGGVNWIQHNKNLTNRAVSSLAFSNDGNTLFAGTHGAGVFRLSIHDQDYFNSLSPKITAEPTTFPKPISTDVQTQEQEEISSQNTKTLEDNSRSENTLPLSIIILFAVLGLILVTIVVFYRRGKLGK